MPAEAACLGEPGRRFRATEGMHLSFSRMSSSPRSLQGSEMVPLPCRGVLCRNRWGVPSSTSAHIQRQSVTPKQCPVFCHCFSIQQSVCQLCGRFKNPSCFHTNRNCSLLLLQMFGFVDRCSNLCYSSPSALFGLGFFISPDTTRYI